MVDVRSGPSGRLIEIPSFTTVDYLDFNPATHGDIPHQEGRLWYDLDHHCFSAYDDATASILEIGQETRIRVVNKTGVTLVDGICAYLSGVQGNRPTVAPALATTLATANAAGVITHDILSNDTGWMTILGTVSDYDTSGFTEDDDLWVSTSAAGALQNTEPTGTNISRLIGKALNSTVNGSILVAPGFPAKLASLWDVDDADPTIAGRILAANGTHWSAQASLMLEGSGSPEGVVAAPLGSLYRNTAGGAGTTLYVKEGGGATATGWVGK